MSHTLLFNSVLLLSCCHLVLVNCLLSILNNMKLADYELKLIFVITHGAKYPKQPVDRNKWFVEEINMLYIRLL